MGDFKYGEKGEDLTGRIFKWMEHWERLELGVDFSKDPQTYLRGNHDRYFGILSAVGVR